MFNRFLLTPSSRRVYFAILIVALLCSVSACKNRTNDDEATESSKTSQEAAQSGTVQSADAAPANDVAPTNDDVASPEDDVLDDGAPILPDDAPIAEVALEAPLMTEEEARLLDEKMLALKDPNAKRDDFDGYLTMITRTKPNPEAALRFIYAYETRFGSSSRTSALYENALARHPVLNAKPRYVKPDREISGMKRLGGGSTLVYKFYKDGKTVAAFKPLQSRYQSNYRSEIAAYRLCPVMKCGFDVPKNFHIYFDFKEFSGLYARNKANLPKEFKEILPTKTPDQAYRVDGTYKEWIPDYAAYPIEITSIWQPWLNPGTTREALQEPVEAALEGVKKRCPGCPPFTPKLDKHIQGVTKYDLARQISNLIVFDFLINNWDRFSGLKSLYGVNCQFANGRFMSIDNGASFSQTPNPKPKKNLHRIQRFSKLTYDAILAFDKGKLLEYLFQEPTVFERQKFETFWNQRQAYLDYVQSCIEKNGESETFFFE